MLSIITTNRFKKDLKRVKKRGKNLDKLEKVVNALQAEIPLDIRYHNHQLIGNWFPS